MCVSEETPFPSSSVHTPHPQPLPCFLCTHVLTFTPWWLPEVPCLWSGFQDPMMLCCCWGCVSTGSWDWKALGCIRAKGQTCFQISLPYLSIIGTEKITGKGRGVWIPEWPLEDWIMHPRKLSSWLCTGQTLAHDKQEVGGSHADADTHLPFCIHQLPWGMVTSYSFAGWWTKRTHVPSIRLGLYSSLWIDG